MQLLESSLQNLKEKLVRLSQGGSLNHDKSPQALRERSNE